LKAPVLFTNNYSVQLFKGRTCDPVFEEMWLFDILWHVTLYTLHLCPHEYTWMCIGSRDFHTSLATEVVPVCARMHVHIHIVAFLCVTMCCVSARPLSPSLIQWMTSPSPPLPSPPCSDGNRELLLIPLLIISFNLRKQARAAVLIPCLKAATGTPTPLCLLLLNIQRGVGGDGSARQKEEEEGERPSGKWRGRRKRKRREWNTWAV